MKRIIAIAIIFALTFCIVGCGHQNKPLTDEALAKIVAGNLGVPESANTTYEVIETFYWEAAEREFKNVTFTENGETVAFASVDPCTGELLRNILKYDGQ